MHQSFPSLWDLNWEESISWNPRIFTDLRPQGLNLRREVAEQMSLSVSISASSNQRSCFILNFQEFCRKDLLLKNKEKVENCYIGDSEGILGKKRLSACAARWWASDSLGMNWFSADTAILCPAWVNELNLCSFISLFSWPQPPYFLFSFYLSPS